MHHPFKPNPLFPSANTWLPLLSHMAWQPRRTLVESMLTYHHNLTFISTFSLADTLLTAPGNIHELQTTLVDGRLYRVYKNLWPSLREFWLAAVAQYAGHIYIVYGDCRLTYLQVHVRAVKVAGLFRSVYGIKNGDLISFAFETEYSPSPFLSLTIGDRVAICSRNCPDYLVVFWACRRFYYPFAIHKIYVPSL